MAIIVSTDGLIKINSTATAGLGISGTNFSDHCRSFVLNDGQETREVTCHGETIRHYRGGIGMCSLEATFRGDAVTGQINQFLTNEITTTTSGAVAVYVRKVAATAQSTNNPGYEMLAVIDGDFTVLSEEHGEVQEISCRLVPFSGGLTIYTSAS